MIYNSINFIIFFPLIFLLYYLIPVRYLLLRNVYLLVVSYLLYINIVPVHSLILLAVTTISYITALTLNKYPSRRKSIVLLGGMLAIFPLLLFKYYNFASNAIYDFLSLLGIRIYLCGLNWAIPIGISFFTLQAIGYVLDVYNNRIQPEKNYIVYATFVSFFPSIISGPINRASVLLSQINNQSEGFDYFKVVKGLRLILWGMFMKVVVADRCGLYVDIIYSDFLEYSGLSCLFASVMFTFQIYSDFAGYSLMAIGVAKMLGFDLEDNFKRPYFSQTVNEFWKRWHISLSSWLKDYVYIPLGGNRNGKTRTYRNILITFFVSGVWHGANWNFIVWGVLHSLWIIVERMVSLKDKFQNNPILVLFKIVVTFIFINFAWIIFRFTSINDAIIVIKKIVLCDNMGNLMMPSGLALLSLVILFAKEMKDEFLPNRLSLLNNRNAIIRWSCYIFLLSLIMLEGVLDSGQFIYANF